MKICSQKQLLNFAITLSAIMLCSVSFNLFLLPTKITSGFSGLTVVANHIWGIKPSVLLLILDIIVLGVSFVTLGVKQTSKSIVGSILYPIFVELSSYITPYIDLGSTEPIVMAICGAVVSGFGFGIIYKLGYNTGGSDVLTQIMGKYLKKPIGFCVLAVNIFIVSSALFVFGFQTALYSIITIILMSYIIDKVMIGISESKSFYVITEEETKVKNYLISNLSHGVTIIPARGGYTGNVIKLIMCIVPTREYIKVKEGILEIDKNALILVSDTYEVLGNKWGDSLDLIRLKNVKKTYKNGVTAIQDLSLNIKKGEFVFIIGSTGCGKSTLIKMMYREEKPTSGSINVGGIEVGKLKNRNVYKIRRKIGVVFQDFKLLPKSTVYENVAFALEIFGLPNSEIHGKVLKALELVGLKHKAKNYPTELSGGEQQRVAIARAIVNGPKLLICDEPTGNLDEVTSMEIMKVLEEINKLGTTIVMVTHDTDIVNRMKKRVILLDSGRILKDYAEGEYRHENV